LRGVFPNKIVLFAWNQTFWPPHFWAGYATALRVLQLIYIVVEIILGWKSGKAFTLIVT